MVADGTRLTFSEGAELSFANGAAAFAPKAMLDVSYRPGSGVQPLQVKAGMAIAEDELVRPPCVRFGGASALALYTLLMLDGDAPQPFVLHAGNSVRHLLVTNVPGQALIDGETGVEGGTILSSYLPPRPPAGSGAHRYRLVLFEQRDGLLPLELSLRTHESRYDWNASRFASEYALAPVGSNWFVCAHDYAGHRVGTTTGSAGSFIAKPLDEPAAHDTVLGVVAFLAIALSAIGVLAVRLSQPLNGRWREHRDNWPSCQSTASLTNLGSRSAALGRASSSPEDGLEPLRETLVSQAAPRAPRAHSVQAVQRSAGTPKRSVSLIVVANSQATDEE